MPPTGRSFDPSYLEFDLKRLSSDVHNPCYLLHLRDINIVLDCGVETSALAHFIPSHQLVSPGCSNLPTSDNLMSETDLVTLGDHAYLKLKPRLTFLDKTQFDSVIWDTVDVILVSNTNSLLGLPFLCTKTKFRGRVLATEPVVKFGKLLMEDIVEALDQSPKSTQGGADNVDGDTKLPPSSTLGDYIKNYANVWKEIYTQQEITDTLDRIQLVAYHEPVDIFGLLTICGSSSGFGIGSCNWVLTSPTEKVAYISHTSLLYSHVLPFDDGVFTDVDVLIVGTVNLFANSHLEKSVASFRHIVVQTLAQGGHVLVPSSPSGLLFDLIETAFHAKENFNGTVSPIFPVDNIANTSTATNAHTTTLESASDATTSTNNTAPPLGGSSWSGRVARSPVFAVSSQINVSLAYANAYGEWLNPEKEALLYTADAPFPFQGCHIYHPQYPNFKLVRLGQLIPLESLHEAPNAKDLTDPTSRRNSPNSNGATTLVFGPNARVGDFFSAPSNNAAQVPDSLTTVSSTLNHPSSTICAPSPPLTSSRDRQSGLSGGVWPNSPCLIFASHPSLRFGPTVHLIRALAYGELRPSGRTIVPTNPTSGPNGSGSGSSTAAAILPRHAIILVESGDYVCRTSQTGKTTIESYVQHLLRPYTQNEHAMATMTMSPTGVLSMNLSDTATVFWLPMEARCGLDDIPQLVSRCRPPRTALCLPAEIASYGTERFGLPDSCAVHFIGHGQSVHLSQCGSSSMHPVNVSTKLMQRIRPVHMANPTFQSSVSTKGPVDPRTRVRKNIDHSRDTASKSTDPDSKKPCLTDSLCEKSVLDQSYIALVDGVLTSRNGKHWLSDTTLGTHSDPTNRSFPQPSTPPPTNGSTSRRGGTSDKLITRSGPENNRIFVSQTPRIDPVRLIKELTERGVTGAYLADHEIVSARRISQRFIWDDDSNPKSKLADYILFPNPSTLIQLSNHGSHIVTADESTRATIRDSILSCLQQLDTSS